MADYFDELFTLCGWESDEIEAERDRISEVFRRLELGVEDCKRADVWIKTYQDYTLSGVRKLLGAWLKELIDTVLAGDDGKKPVYYGMPAILGPGFVLAGASDDTHCCCPDYTLSQVLGTMFNKLTPLIAAGEGNGMPPGHALCTLWQVKMGALAKGIIPVPDLTISSRYFCDMSGIGDNLIRGLYGSEMAVIDNCIGDGPFGEWPHVRPERIKFLGSQMDNVLKKAEKVLGVHITPDALEKGARVAKEFQDRVGQLIELMKADPVPTNAATLQLIEGLPPASTRRGVAEGVKAMDILIAELKERVDKGIGGPGLMKGAPRVMSYHLHVADPRCNRVIEDAGLVFPITLVIGWLGGLPVNIDKVYDTLGENLAAREFAQGLVYGVDGTLERFALASELVHLDGFLLKTLYNCRPAAAVSRSAKHFLEERTGLPAITIEEDMVDSRVYSADYHRTQLETFAEMLRARKEWQKVDNYHEEIEEFEAKLSNEK